MVVELDSWTIGSAKFDNLQLWTFCKAGRLAQQLTGQMSQQTSTSWFATVHANDMTIRAEVNEVQGKIVIVGLNNAGLRAEN